MNKFTAPLINTNGTDGDDLLHVHRVAVKALEAARLALRDTCPHPRDWQTCPDANAFSKAYNEHYSRIVDLGDMIREIELITIAISNQVEERKERRRRA